jgi:hypothetical protein
MTDWQFVMMAVAFLYATTGSIVMLTYAIFKFLKDWRDEH